MKEHSGRLYLLIGLHSQIESRCDLLTSLDGTNWEYRSSLPIPEGEGEPRFISDLELVLSDNWTCVLFSAGGYFYTESVDLRHWETPTHIKTSRSPPVGHRNTIAAANSGKSHFIFLTDLKGTPRNSRDESNNVFLIRAPIGTTPSQIFAEPFARLTSSGTYTNVVESKSLGSDVIHYRAGSFHFGNSQNHVPEEIDICSVLISDV